MISSSVRAAKQAKRFVSFDDSAIQGQYSSNAIVIAGDSITNCFCEDRFSGKNGVVKVRDFPGPTIEDMQRNLT